MKDNIAEMEGRSGNSLLKLSGWGKLSPTIRGLLLVALTILSFYFLFRQIDLAQVVHLLSGVPPLAWISATLLTFSFPVMSAVRWHLVLRTMGLTVSISRCLLIIVGIWPLSSISPSKSGDLLKAVCLRDEIKPAIIAGSVLTERALDVLTLSLFALAGGLLFQDLRITLMAAAIAGAVICAMLVARSGIKLPVGRKMQATLEDLFQSLKLLGSRPGLLAAVLLMTMGNWLASFLQTTILFDGVGASVPFGFTVTALPIAIFAGLLPITFGGMGTRDGAMVVLFGAFSTAPQALAVGILYSFFGYWLLAILGLPYIKKALRL